MRNFECGIKMMNLVTSPPANQGRTTKPCPARQSGSLSGRVQTSRRRLARTHRHGRNINAHPPCGFSRRLGRFFFSWGKGGMRNPVSTRFEFGWRMVLNGIKPPLRLSATTLLNMFQFLGSIIRFQMEPQLWWRLQAEEH